MHISCLKFISDNIVYDEIKGKRIIEVGSLDVNGSPKYILGLLHPKEYIGVDVEKGPGVDLVCDAENLSSLDRIIRACFRLEESNI